MLQNFCNELEQQKRYFFTVVEEAIMNPEYQQFRGGRSETIGNFLETKRRKSTKTLCLTAGRSPVMPQKMSSVAGNSSWSTGKRGPAANRVRNITGLPVDGYGSLEGAREDQTIELKGTTGMPVGIRSARLAAHGRRRSPAAVLRIHRAKEGPPCP